MINGIYTIALWMFCLWGSEQFLFELTDFGSQINSISVTNDGKRLYAVSEREGLWEFNLSSRKLTKFQSLQNFEPVHTAISSDGRWLAVTGLGICIFDNTTRTIHYRSASKNDNHIWSSSFSGDGKYLVFGGEDKAVSIFDVRLKKVIRSFASKRNITAVAFSPDNKWIAAGNTEGEIRLWNLCDKDALRYAVLTSVELQPVISTIHFSPDSKVVSCANWNGQVFFLNAADRPSLKIIYEHEEGVTKLCFSKDGKYLSSSGSDKKVIVFNVKNSKKIALLENFFREVDSFDYVGSNQIAASFRYRNNKKFTIRIYNIK